MINIEILTAPNRNHDVFVAEVRQFEDRDVCVRALTHYFANTPHWSGGLRIDGQVVQSLRQALSAIDAGTALREVCDARLL
jgi:hypothetical protein